MLIIKGRNYSLHCNRHPVGFVRPHIHHSIQIYLGKNLEHLSLVANAFARSVPIGLKFYEASSRLTSSIILALCQTALPRWPPHMRTLPPLVAVVLQR